MLSGDRAGVTLGARLDQRRHLMRACIRTEDCWTWRTSARQPRVRIGGRQRMAAHVMWWVVYGEWPPVVRNRVGVVPQCGNRRCIRPRHLALLTTHEVLVLRADRLELVVWHECQRCGRRFRVRRSLAIRGLGKYCSIRCYWAMV